MLHGTASKAYKHILYACTKPRIPCLFLSFFLEFPFYSQEGNEYAGLLFKPLSPGVCVVPPQSKHPERGQHNQRKLKQYTRRAEDKLIIAGCNKSFISSWWSTFYYWAHGAALFWEQLIGFWYIPFQLLGAQLFKLFLFKLNHCGPHMDQSEPTCSSSSASFHPSEPGLPLRDRTLRIPATSCLFAECHVHSNVSSTSKWMRVMPQLPSLEKMVWSKVQQ